MTLTIPNDDAIWVAGSLYCKTPEALQVALDTLRGIGYTIENLRDPENSYSGRADRGVTTEQMEQNGWSLWFAHLVDLRRGKCKSCNSYISMSGIQMHGHACEVCGAVTYLDLTEDSTVKFTFRGEDRGWFSPSLQMTVKRWDAEDGWLYLKREVHEGRWGIMGPEETETYLAQYADKWEAVEEDGQPLIKLRYHLHRIMEPVNPETVIEVTDTWGHHFNFKTVRLWDGVEYDEYNFGDKALPVPESVSIYESWHWTPLEPSPTLHERIISAVHQVSDAGYYYQDGRPAWSRRTYEEMGKFVRHFTSLDADAWDRQSTMFRLDGPGGIADVAKFCHPDAVVENRPNIGNFLVGTSKLMSGQSLTSGEATAMKAAFDEDPDTQDFAKDVVQKGLFGRRRK